jgi:hypothetical protein
VTVGVSLGEPGRHHGAEQFALAVGEGGGVDRRPADRTAEHPELHRGERLGRRQAGLVQPLQDRRDRHLVQLVDREAVGDVGDRPGCFGDELVHVRVGSWTKQVRDRRRHRAEGVDDPFTRVKLPGSG